MVIVNVTYKCKESHSRNEFLKALLKEGLDKKCQADAGNIKYHYYLPALDDNTLLLVEQWEDEESIRQHLKQPHMTRIAELKEEYVESAELKLMEQKEFKL